ncbi:hypothetical protein J3R82DRAFT_1513 [Butyriboletus roseoflavus]|nr:hypothetical protein J3R82DRAFT_1513 [Butyriboletus roseoflavus]
MPTRMNCELPLDGMPVDHLGTRFERLQAALDNPHQESSLRNIALEPFSSPRRAKERHVADTHPIDMCGSLAGKRITMIGGEHIYRLHVLLLQSRERAEEKPFPCQYHEFCTHHNICLPYRHFQDDIPPPRYIKPPTTQELIETESAVVNYIVSDTLFSARNESSWEYNFPFVDPITGVRLRETYWLAAARKANVVVFGRGPLSAPGQTYTGNWSFLRHVPDYVDQSRVAIVSEYKNHDNVDRYQMVPRSLEILNAAVHLTVSRFLPEVFQFLRSIRREVRPSRRKRLIWPSDWYRLPCRGVARAVFLRLHVRSRVQDMMQQTFFHSRRPSAEHVLTTQLSALINADGANTALLEDPWTFLFNAQGEYMMERELLPQYGIVFLPLDIPWIEDARACRHGHKDSHDAATDVDLEQMGAIGEAFLTGMDYVLRYLE